ncbi:MAG: hypothetical protein JXA15_00655 [Spirochaetales bacterium]|nr:hypothetical protein [Spirochaetales bacterium]
MDLRGYARNFLASPLGLGTAAAAALVAFGTWQIAGWIAGLVAGSAAYIAANALALATGLGPKAAAREAERRMANDNREALAVARASRDRLATLRVADADVSKAVSLCALRASAYLAACEKSGVRDPRADHAVEDCVHLVALYLEELDDASTEKRYDLADDAPFADAKSRVLAALAERAALLDRAALDAAGGHAPVDRMAAREELR